MRRLQDQVVTNKNILLRVDFNVPTKDGIILDDIRIKKCLPTLEYLIKNQAKIIIASHFGRPKGQKNPDFSLKIIFQRLKELLPNAKISFVDDCIGEDVQKAVEVTNYGEILLLENVRFHKGETDNDPEFAQKLSSLANLHINEAFSCCHRSHASIVGVANYIKSCAGFLLQDEIDNLENILTNPEKPMLAIVGGSKISTKIDLLNNLTKKADYIFVAGGMANTFLYALGKNIGNSIVEKDLAKTALKIIENAKKHGCEIILPSDIASCSNLDNISNFKISDINKISDDEIIADIGTETLKILEEKINRVKTIVWNGPLGITEIKEFSVGTDELAKIVANKTQNGELISVAGGGDIVSALNKSSLANKFTYISTAGGAFLEWLEGKNLPGIKSCVI
jgi:3-phosphoglycerate kinase